METRVVEVRDEDDYITNVITIFNIIFVDNDRTIHFYERERTSRSVHNEDFGDFIVFYWYWNQKVFKRKRTEMKNKEIFSVENLTKRYQKFFLNNVCMKILPGEIVGIIGPNGAGKSTTLKIILGIIDADSGTIVMKDEKINKDNHKKIKGKIGYVGEDPSFFEKSRLKEIKNFYRLFYDTWDEQYYRRLMERFELLDDYKVIELSKGMKVKFSLCLALSHKPELLVLDEPTSGLDPLVRNEILALLKEYAEEYNAGIIFSSHITEDMEKIAEKLIFIYKGNVLDQCATKNLLEQGISIDTYLENLINGGERL